MTHVEKYWMSKQALNRWETEAASGALGGYIRPVDELLHSPNAVKDIMQTAKNQTLRTHMSEAGFENALKVKEIRRQQHNGAFFDDLRPSHENKNRTKLMQRIQDYLHRPVSQTDRRYRRDADYGLGALPGLERV